MSGKYRILMPHQQTQGSVVQHNMYSLFSAAENASCSKIALNQTSREEIQNQMAKASTFSKTPPLIKATTWRHMKGKNINQIFRFKSF